MRQEKKNVRFTAATLDDQLIVFAFSSYFTAFSVTREQNFIFFYVSRDNCFNADCLFEFCLHFFARLPFPYRLAPAAASAFSCLALTFSLASSRHSLSTPPKGGGRGGGDRPIVLLALLGFSPQAHPHSSLQPRCYSRASAGLN